jgi:hypothetical protein
MTYAALIFSHSITPRLQYIVDFLSQYYGLSFRLTSDEDNYRAAKDNCKINYSYHRLVKGEIFIHPHALLSESYIRQVKVECFDHNGYAAFFKTEGDTSFDLFAGTFFLLTRFEEYLPFKKDAYGRFDHTNSIAFKNGFLHQPLVNIWLEDFRTMLSAKNPEFSTRKSSFRFLPTYDIDMAWSFRNKGLKRNAGGIALLLLRLKFRRTSQRIKVLRKKNADPYDAYGWMDQLHQQFKLKPYYFFLVSKDTGRLDKNIDPKNPEFIQLIRDTASKYDIGLHPSWASGDLPSLLTSEKHRLEDISQRRIHDSRQHFIRFQLPATYRRLISLGLNCDYSMGYGSINGFRASIATPYYWYDLKNEEKTELRIFPFCFMDANAYYEQGLSAPAALEELDQYLKQIKSVGGTMITIWHNSFLGTDESFAGWKETYHEFISRATAV